MVNCDIAVIFIIGMQASCSVFDLRDSEFGNAGPRGVADRPGQAGEHEAAAGRDRRRRSGDKSPMKISYEPLRMPDK